MTDVKSSCRAGASWLVGLLAITLFAPVPSNAGPSRAPATPDAIARHWAGNFALHRATPTRVEHTGSPGVLSDLLATSSSDSADGTWSLLAGSGVPDPAPARVGHSAIYDPLRGRVVVFGGTGVSDTWVLSADDSAWVTLATQGTPPSPRWLHSAVYDAENDRMVVFGGSNYDLFNDVWALSFGSDPPTWTELSPSGPLPAARASHAAIYDPQGRRMIVFAGTLDRHRSTPLKDVWALSLDGAPAWTEISPAADGPSARSDLEAVYDSQRGRMVVFGGIDTGLRNDAWALALDGEPRWSAIEALGDPPAARAQHSAIYDAANDRVVVFGGYDASYYYGDTWALTLSGIPQWTELEPTGQPPAPRWGHTAVYDGAATRMILFGGYALQGLSGDSHVLGLSGTPSWTNPIEGPGPGPMRHTFASAYDSRRDRFVLFGGSDVASYLDDVWTIALGEHPQWSVLTTQGTPPTPRRLVEGVYDPEGDRLIVFGGFDGTILGDLWQLSFATHPPTWSPLDAGGSAPVPRAGHGVIYDPHRKRMIVFGGFDGVSENYRRNDLWALNLDDDPDWEELSPRGTPPSPRSSPSVVYDPDHHRMILFGGTTPTFLNETWALSLEDEGRWTRLSPGGAPPSPREEHSAMYDPVRGRMVFFGGYEDPGFYGTLDTWALSLGANPEWRMLSPAGPQPTFRWGHAAVYDPTYDRMVMHGGLGPGLDQTWALTWGRPESASPTLVDAQAQPDLVRLTWSVTGGAFLTAAVYRSMDGGPWTLEGVAQVRPSGETVFEDHSVTAGVRYGYRVGVMAGGIEKLSSTTWVNVPQSAGVGETPATLAILGVRWSAEELAVRISLANGEAARLVLYDLGGRTLASRELGAPGLGRREVSLAGHDRIPAGIYWLRLSQAGRAVTSKTAALR